MEINHKEEKQRKNQNLKMVRRKKKRNRRENQKNPKNQKRNETKMIKKTLIQTSHYLYQAQRKPLLASPQAVLVHQRIAQKSMNSHRIVLKNRPMTNYDRLFYSDLTPLVCNIFCKF